MKKLFILLFVLAGFSKFAQASDKVSPKILSSFLLTFHDARDISWEEMQGFSIAIFTQDGVRKSAYYNEEGKLVVIGRAISPDDLPAHMNQKLAQSYKGYTLTALFEMQDDAGISYFATVNNGKKVKVLKAGTKKWQCLRTRKA